MPLIRRRRPLLRAAAVGGGAYALGRHRERKQEEAYYDDQPPAPAAPPVQAAPAGPSGITNDDVQRLTELGKLREQGILTDEEFASQKARILGPS